MTGGEQPEGSVALAMGTATDPQVGHLQAVTQLVSLQQALIEGAGRLTSRAAASLSSLTFLHLKEVIAPTFAKVPGCLAPRLCPLGRHMSLPGVIQISIKAVRASREESYTSKALKSVGSANHRNLVPVMCEAGRGRRETGRARELLCVFQLLIRACLAADRLR